MTEVVKSALTVMVAAWHTDPYLDAEQVMHLAELGNPNSTCGVQVTYWSSSTWHEQAGPRENYCTMCADVAGAGPGAEGRPTAQL